MTDLDVAQLAPLGTIASEVSAVIAIRTLPCVVWALLARRVALPEKAMALFAYGSLVVLASSGLSSFPSVLAQLTVGAGYFAGTASALAWACVRGLQRGMPRLVALALCLLLFLVGPWLLFHGLAAVVLLLAGWELTFSAYSYLVETAGRAQRGSLRDGLFFLLVDPTLCFPERGTWSDTPGSLGSSLTRCASGALLLLAAISLLHAVPALAAVEGPRGRSALTSYGAFVALHGGTFVRTYFTHSGVASLQLGLLSLMGFRVSERYCAPLRASGPADFWRRWNVYVGAWLRRYVFNPLSYVLARRVRASSTARTALAVMLTFMAAGVAHDLVWLLQAGRFGVGLIAFSFQGLVLLVFEALSRSSLRTPLRGSVALRLCFWHSMLVMVWLLMQLRAHGTF